MLHAVHVLASRLRHTSLLERQRWLWDRLEPAWQRAFGSLTRRNGFLTHVNGDMFRLVYEVGARYERHDKHVYEPLIYNAWVGVIRPGMTVLDIGAHYGFFSLAASVRVGPGGRVFAFEPTTATLAILREHVRLNRFEERMIVIPDVVGDAEGDVKFYSEGTSMSASLGFSNVKDLCPRHPEVVDETLVPATTVDAFCQRRSIVPDLVKIDVEGAELLVLRGAAATLRKYHPRVLCEIHPLQMANLSSTVEQLTRFVQDLGYTITKIDAPNPQGIYHAWLECRR